MLNDDWCQRLADYNRWFIGFSGGLDSTVLLHVLSRLPDAPVKLTAVHLNHGLSQSAGSWSEHCINVCRQLGVQIIVENLFFNADANIEEQARNARYAVFESMLGMSDVFCVAHHADDQAETVILQLMRGAGVDGLSAMPAEKKLGHGILARPLLKHSRQVLEDYARKFHLHWIEDESNQDLKFSRNYVRHKVMPVLLKKWPQAVSRLGVTAENCQQAGRHLKLLAQRDCAVLNERSLNLEPILNLTLDRLSNVVRFWLQKNNIRISSAKWFQCLMRELVFAQQQAQPCLHAGQWLIRRYRHVLYLIEDREDRVYTPRQWDNFPAPLHLTPDGPWIYARKADVGIHVPSGKSMSVRFRCGGEKVGWYGQSQALKTLFQEWGVPTWERQSVPLIYCDDDLVAVAGIAGDERHTSILPDIYRIYIDYRSDYLQRDDLE